MGRLLPLGGVPPLTVLNLLFNAGGTETVRGYSEDELSAYDFLGVPLGGTKLFVGNAEFRAALTAISAKQRARLSRDRYAGDAYGPVQRDVRIAAGLDDKRGKRSEFAVQRTRSAIVSE